MTLAKANSNPRESPLGREVIVDVADQLAIYDALPPALRELYDSQPELSDVREFWRVWEILEHNTPRAYALIATELERVYHGWNRNQDQHPRRKLSLSVRERRVRHQQLWTPALARR